MKRKFRLEVLESRQLMASDVIDNPLSAANAEEIPAQMRNLVTAEEYKSMTQDLEKSLFLGSLASSFGWQDNLRPVQIGNSLISVVGRELRLLGSSESDTGYQQLSQFRTFDDIMNVTAMGDRLLVVTQRTNALQTKFDSTLILLGISADQRLIELDRTERPLQFQQVSATNTGYQVIWDVPNSSLEAKAALKPAKYTLEVSSDVAYSFVYDVIPSGASRLSNQPEIGVLGGGMAIMYSDSESLIARANNQLYLFDVSSGTSVTLPTGNLSLVTEVTAEGDQLLLHGEMGTLQYGTVRLDGAHQIVSQTVALTGEAARLELEKATIKGLYNDGRVSDVTVFPGLNGQLRVVSEVDGSSSEQTLTLPGLRVGFRPAFVIDSSTIVSIRAHIDVASVTRDSVPDLTLHVLKRMPSGQFVETEALPLGNFDFRAAAFVQDDGTITIQNQQGARVVRMIDNHVYVQIIDLPQTGPTIGTYAKKLTAFDDISLVTDANRTAVVDTNASDASTATIVNSSTSQSKLDVNGDGHVTPLDALLILNHLNAQTEISATDEFDVGNDAYFDMNGDAFVTALDALLVINQLNSAPSADSAEGEAPIASSPLQYAFVDIEDVLRAKRR